MLPDRWISLFIIILALFLLAAIEYAGYYTWIRPIAARLTRAGKLLLMLVILTLAGGFIGAFSWWFNIPGAFGWALPPLAGRMLASAGWSFAFVSWIALQRPTWRRLRLILWMLAIYLTPLLVLLLVFHLNRLDFTQPITYPFLAVALVLPGGAIGFLIRQPVVLPDTPQDLVPASQLSRAWLGLVAAISAAWSLALFFTDHGPSNGVWAWPGDLLTSRLIAVMLFTIAIAGIYSLARFDTARIMSGVTLIYGLGLALASAWNILAGKPVNLLYLVVFGLIALGSAIVLINGKSRRV